MTLIGTDFLPPIGNQGSIGSCSSSSIAYCQFSNAVARYLYSLDKNSDFKPATGKSEYLISSKFAMNFSGAGTAWVYDVIKDHGALTRADSDFWRNSNGGASGGIKNVIVSIWTRRGFMFYLICALLLAGLGFLGKIVFDMLPKKPVNRRDAKGFDELKHV